MKNYIFLIGFIALALTHVMCDQKSTLVKFEVGEKEHDEDRDDFRQIGRNFRDYVRQVYSQYDYFRDYVRQVSKKVKKDYVEAYKKVDRWYDEEDPIYKLNVSTDELNWYYYGTARELDSIKCILKNRIIHYTIKAKEKRIKDEEKRIKDEKIKADNKMKLKNLANKIGKTCE